MVTLWRIPESGIKGWLAGVSLPRRVEAVRDPTLIPSHLEAVGTSCDDGRW